MIKSANLSSFEHLETFVLQASQLAEKDSRASFQKQVETELNRLGQINIKSAGAVQVPLTSLLRCINSMTGSDRKRYGKSFAELCKLFRILQALHGVKNFINPPSTVKELQHIGVFEVLKQLTCKRLYNTALAITKLVRFR